MLNGGALAVVLAASLLGGFVKGVTGLGYTLIAVPIISVVLGIDAAVVIVAAPNLVAGALLCWETRDAASQTRDLPTLLVASFIGAFVGTYLLVSVPEDALLILLLFTIIVYIVSFLRSSELRVSPTTTARWSPPVGLLAGVMQGSVGVPGPVVAVWLHGYRLPARPYVFSVTTIFGVAGIVQVVLLGVSGAVTRELALLSVLALIPALAMLPVGSRMRERLGGRGFDCAVLGVVAVSGISLVLRILS